MICVFYRTEKYRSRQELNRWAIVIQKFFHNFIGNIWLKVARRALAHFRSSTLSLLIQRNQSTTAMDLLNNPSIGYFNPGIDARSASYHRLMTQRTVVCNILVECRPESSGGSTLSLVDLQIFGLLLRNPLCRLERLILCDCHLPRSDDVLTAMRTFFSALSKCLTLQSLWLVGGYWCKELIQDTCHLTQVQNARIRELAIEKVHNSNMLYEQIGSSSSRLLKDYFNYTLPGLHTLSLHACCLRDEQMHLLAEGVQVNLALRGIYCSSNWITDKGLLEIFNAVKANPKGIVEVLDFSGNMITLGEQVKSSLLKYRTKSHQKVLMELVLVNNPIHKPFEEVDFAISQRIAPQFVIRYNNNNATQNKTVSKPVKAKSNRATKKSQIENKGMRSMLTTPLQPIKPTSAKSVLDESTVSEEPMRKRSSMWGVTLAMTQHTFSYDA
jgi:hypothetical protein